MTTHENVQTKLKTDYISSEIGSCFDLVSFTHLYSNIEFLLLENRKNIVKVTVYCWSRACWIETSDDVVIVIFLQQSQELPKKIPSIKRYINYICLSHIGNFIISNMIYVYSSDSNFIFYFSILTIDRPKVGLPTKELKYLVVSTSRHS